MRRVLLAFILVATAASAQVLGDEPPLAVVATTSPDQPLGPEESGEVVVAYALSCAWVRLGGGPLTAVRAHAGPEGPHLRFDGTTTQEVDVAPCQDPAVASVPFEMSFALSLAPDAPGEVPLEGTITTTVTRSGPLEATSEPVAADLEVQARFIGALAVTASNATSQDGTAVFAIDVRNDGNSAVRVQALLLDAPTGVQVVMPDDLVLDAPGATGTLTGTAHFGPGAPREGALTIQVIPLSTRDDSLEGDAQDLQVGIEDTRPVQESPLPVVLAVAAAVIAARRRK